MYQGGIFQKEQPSYNKHRKGHMFNRTRKFISVCGVTTVLIACFVSAGLAASGRVDDNDYGRKTRKERKQKPAPAPAAKPAPAPKPALAQVTAPVSPPDGAALYNQHCAGCHGFSMRGKSAAAILSAINRNVSAMSYLKSLTLAQITAISAGR